MRILVVSNMYPSETNPGFGVFVKNFEIGLEAYGVILERSVIVGRPRSILRKVLSYLFFFARTARLIFFRRYDCVYVHYVAHSLIPIVPFLPLLRARRTALVCNAHGEDLLPRTFFENLIFSIVRRSIESSEFLVVPSPFFLNIARSKFPSLELFVSASGGVDLDIFKPAKNLPEGTCYRVGYVSRIDAGKGWHVLLQAISLIRSRFPNMRLEVDLVGEGREVDQLIETIKSLGLQECVRYKGALPQDKLPDFFSTIDVFVFSTELQESLGLVGLEAMACSIPVICSDIGGMRGYMQDGVNGYLFPAGDSEALAQKLMAFFEHSESEIMNLKSGAVATAKKYSRQLVSSELYRKIAEVVKS